MSNQLTAPQAPSFLARFASAPAVVGASAIAGISTGGHHKISIKGSRWRLQDVQGNEQVIPTFHLDVIIVAANANLSKVFYATKYDKDSEPLAPDCFSDNGVGPSSRATKPQASSCATCPHNVWGSVVTEAGKKTRACGDSKKVAVVLADNPDGPVYELKIPAASMANFANTVNQVLQHIKDINGHLELLVFRLSFDSTADFPKILFEPLGYITEEQGSVVERIVGKQEVVKIVGGDDTPYDAATVQDSVAATAILPQAAPAPSFLPTQAVAQAPAQGAATAPSFFAKLQSAPVQAPAAASEAPKKARKKSSDEAPSMAAPLPPAGGFFANRQDLPHAASPAASVVTNPVVTDDALDGLLGDALS